MSAKSLQQKITENVQRGRCLSEAEAVKIAAAIRKCEREDEQAARRMVQDVRKFENFMNTPRGGAALGDVRSKLSAIRSSRDEWFQAEAKASDAGKA